MVWTGGDPGTRRRTLLGALALGGGGLIGGLPQQRPDQGYQPPSFPAPPGSSTGNFRRITIGTTVIIAPSGDTTGVTDTAGIQGTLNAGFNVQLAAGVFYLNASINLPAGSSLTASPRGLGVPTDNYGAGGLALAQTVIKPVAAFVGGAVIRISQPNTTPEIGQVAISGIGIDGSLLPGGNAVDGIATFGNVAALTITNVTVWNVGGNGMRGDLNSHNQPGNFWWVEFCKVADCGANGYLGVGLSDCNFVACEASTNGGDGFRFQDAVNMRLTGCKSEWNGGPTSAGFHFVNTAGNGSYASLTGCTTEQNWTSGMLFTGAGPSNLGTILITGYQSNHDNRGAVAGTAAIQSVGFGGRVMASNVKTDGSTVYGASQTANSFQMHLTGCAIFGTTAPTNDDGTNSLALVSQDQIPQDPPHPITTGFPAGWTGSVNYFFLHESRLVCVNINLSVAAGTAITVGEIINTIPAGYRPPSRKQFVIDASPNVAADFAAEMQIGTTGNIVWTNPAFTVGAGDTLILRTDLFYTLAV